MVHHSLYEGIIGFSIDCINDILVTGISLLVMCVIDSFIYMWLMGRGLVTPQQNHAEYLERQCLSNCKDVLDSLH
jgi:uncharacterized membrane protein